MLAKCCKLPDLGLEKACTLVYLDKTVDVRNAVVQTGYDASEGRHISHKPRQEQWSLTSPLATISVGWLNDIDMASVVVPVANISHLRSSYDFKASPRRATAYTLDLPLSPNFPIGIKPGGQSEMPGALDDEVNVVVAPGSETSSLSSYSNDEHDLILATSPPLLNTDCDREHFAVSLNAKKLSASVSPHSSNLPTNCKRSAEVSENPRVAPASQGLSQSDQSARLGDTTALVADTPPPLPPKDPRRYQIPTPASNDELSSRCCAHPTQRPLYKSNYSASEPGHGDSSSRIGKPAPLQPSAYRSYAAIRGTAEGHSVSLRVLNAQADPPRRQSIVINGDSTVDSPPYSATMPFPSSSSNEDNYLLSPLQSLSYTVGPNMRPAKKLKKPPPSGYRSPAERMARMRSIAMTSKPQCLIDGEIIVDSNDPSSTLFPSSSSENAHYFAQSQPEPEPTPPPLIREPSTLHLRSTTTRASSSCTSGSGSGDDSTFSASSMYASTAPTSPSATSESAHKSTFSTYYDHLDAQRSSSQVNSPRSPRSQMQTYRFPSTSPHRYTQPSSSYIHSVTQGSPASQKPYYIPDYPPPPPPPPKSPTSPTSRKLTKKKPTSKPITSLPPPSRSAHEARLLESAQQEQAQTHTRTIFGVKFTLSSPTKEKKGWLGRSKSQERSQSQSRERKNSNEKQRRKSSWKWSPAEDGKQPQARMPTSYGPPRVSSAPYIPTRFISSPTLPISPIAPSIRSPTSPNILRKPRLSQPSSSRVLTDFAFTGTSSALSSSAVAALTSQLSVKEHSPERFNSNWEPDYSPYRQYARSSYYPDEIKSDDGHGMVSTSEFGVKPKGKAQSEIGHGSSYSTYGMAAMYSTPFTKTHGNSGPSKSSTTSFLDQDPYAQPQFHPRTRYRDSLQSHQIETQNRPQSQAHEIPLSLEQRRRETSRRRSSNGQGDPLVENMRRWTLALDVSDDVLIQELERLRKEGVRGRQRSRTRNSNAEGREESIRRTSGVEFVYGGPSTSTSRPPARARSPLGSSGRSGMFHLGDKGTNNWELDGDESDDDDDEDYPFSDEEEVMVAEDDSDWKIARRALLCCRELILTERAYQNHLRTLLSGDITPTIQYPRVPALVLTYLPALLRASEAFLSRMEEDPSAWGVSAAWLGCEEEMEGAFVGWCGVVGELFVDGDSRRERVYGYGYQPNVGEARENGRKVLRKTTPTSSRRASIDVAPGYATRIKSGVFSPPLPQPQFPSGRRMSASGTQSGMFTAALGTGLPYGLSPPMPTSPQCPTSPQSRHDSDSLAFSPLTPPTSPNFMKGHKNSTSASLAGSLTAAFKRKSFLNSTSSLVGSEKEKEKKVTLSSVRELAIQPTQRIMRYVLQYRDLLQHTPASSPSRALVERAVDSAMRIAQKCDRAQDNSAFLRR